MNYLKLLVTLAGMALLFSSVNGQNMRIDRDGMAVINGKRTFILGMYEFPDDGMINQVANAGFNIIAVPFKDSATTKKSLDKLAAHKMGAWISTNFDLSRNPDKVKKQLQTMSRFFSSHPSLLVWEVPDEAVWNISTRAWEYRVNKELKMLNALIAEIKDSVKRESLKERADAARTCYFTAEYRKGQQIADSLMTVFSKPVAGADFDLTATWRLADESAAGLKKGYDFMKTVDPDRPVFMNHAPRNTIPRLTSYSQAADIIGCDIYPVPEYKIEHSDLADLSMASVGNYTQRMRQAAGGKPVWMVLQGFGWGDLFTYETPEKRKELRQPTLEETRFMAYDAIANGARGICYWGTYLIDKESRFWKDLLLVTRELSSLQPVLSSKDAQLKMEISIDETYNSFDRPIRVLPKQVDKELQFIVVNENKNKNPVIYSISGLEKLNGTLYTDLLSGRKSRVENGALRFPVTGQAVQVLQPVNR
jgi:hypothetical protein